MESISYKEREQNKAIEVAKDYKDDGYEVVLNPSPSDLPKFLENFAPDIYAFKGNEFIIVEVVSKESLKQSSHLKKLSELISANKNWKFDLVITNPRIEEIENHLELTEMSYVELKKRISDSKKLFRSGYLEPALLISWANFETIARWLIKKAQPKSITKLSSKILVKQLFTLGIIGKVNYNQLNEFSLLRNRIAHGFYSSKNSLTKTKLTKLIVIIDTLLEEYRDR